MKTELEIGGTPAGPDGAAALAPSTQPRREGVQVIARAARIMRVLADAPEGLTLGQLAEQVGLPRSTVHRITSALDAEDLVRTAASGALQLGPALIGLAAAGRGDLRHEAARYMERLSHELHETVDLAVLDGGQVLFIDQYTSRRRLRIVSEIGAQFPLHCTANGKALLAELPRPEVERLLPEQLPQLTENTIPTRVGLLEELVRVRAAGVACDREEHTMGMSAVGTVVKDGRGAMAAITVVMPTARFEGSEERVTSALLRTQDEIQAALGVDTKGTGGRKR
jgi:DNA-binding IclR family transcriptional regulator